MGHDVDDVDRVDRLSPAQLEEEFLERERPVILTGALQDWSASRWTLEGLRERCGSRELRVRGGDRQTWRLLCRVPADQYIDFLLGRGAGDASGNLARNAHHRPYAAFNSLTILEQDIAFEALVPPAYVLTAPMVWIGPERSLTPLHYDASGITALAQIAGRKRIQLFPFSETRNLYPSDIFDWQSVFSEVNLDAPDLHRHPRYRRARPIEIVLGPGEILIFPNKMWHQVEALDTSISVTRRMKKDSPPSLETVQWYSKALLHLLGLYKKQRCLCHIDELTPKDLAVYSPVIRWLVRVGGVSAHGHDLSELIGWTKP